MFTKQILIDGALAVGLMSALFVVLKVDQNKPAPPVREIEEGEDPGEGRGSLISTNPQVVVRKKIQPRADSIYVERVTRNDEFVKKHGGSQVSELAVKNGLDWLSRHQAQEGYWSNQCIASRPRGQCEKQQPCGGPGGDHAVGQTGLALLAFQGAGHFWFNETDYSIQVKRGLDWLIDQQRQDGQFGTGTMYEHAIGTFALAEACATAMQSDHQADRKQQEALERAVTFLEKSQNRYGGWRYSPGEAGDTSVSGWVVLALKSAVEAGVKVDAGCLQNCIAFFKTCELKSDGRTGYVGRSVATEATTGVGMLVHHFLLKTSDSPLVKAASAYLARYAESAWGDYRKKPPDYYLWYNCTLGMYLAGGDNWDKWNAVVRKQLEQLQVRTLTKDQYTDKNCERGSWPPIDRWGSEGGRIYSTSLAILTLEVYYRFAKKPQGQ